MKIIAISGSPRNKASQYVAQKALDSIREKYPEMEIQLISLKGKKVEPCNACDYCKRKKDWCIMKDDGNSLIQDIVTADGLLLVSPVYVMEPTPQLMGLFSRMRPLHHVYQDVTRHMLGASIAVGGTRNGGQEIAVNTMNNILLSRGISVVANEAFGYHGGKVWSKDQGAEGAEADEIGMKTAIQVALKLAEMVELVASK
jgi:multimeric flavodoxin WrbA